LKCVSNKAKQTKIKKIKRSTYFRENVSDISCGTEHIVAVTEDGQVFVWGNNVDGRLGTGDIEEVLLPRKVYFKINFYRKK
jgi:alpha-tubulin suppressor-like RCC1 family protein